MKKGSSRLLRLSHYVELPVCPFRAPSLPGPLPGPETALLVIDIGTE
jgi:hypothetical protein